MYRIADIITALMRRNNHPWRMSSIAKVRHQVRAAAVSLAKEIVEGRTIDKVYLSVIAVTANLTHLLILLMEVCEHESLPHLYIVEKEYTYPPLHDTRNTIRHEMQPKRALLCAVEFAAYSNEVVCFFRHKKLSTFRIRICCPPCTGATVLLC